MKLLKYVLYVSVHYVIAGFLGAKIASHDYGWAFYGLLFLVLMNVFADIMLRFLLEAMGTELQKQKTTLMKRY